MIFDILFPKYCFSCEKAGAYLCSKCKSKLTMHQEICHICHKESKNFEVHTYCKEYSNLEALFIGFDYNKFLKKILIHFKYYHRKVLIETLGELLYINFITNSGLELSGEDAIFTFVPMHFVRRHFIKGYNQAEILANYLGKKLDISTKEICKKKRYTRPQAGLNKKKRLKNLDNSFVFGKQDLSSTQQIIIIDDITTTGTTLEKVAFCIKNKYPKIKIYGLVLARN